MKLLQEPIEVQTRRGVPHRVTWRHRAYPVRGIEEKWLYNGKWWVTAQLVGQARRYYRLEVESPVGGDATMEVFEEEGGWVLARLQD